MIYIQSFRAKIGIFHLKSIKFKPLKSKNINPNSKSNNFLILFLFILLSAQINSNSSLTTKLKANKTTHSINGNISAKGSLKFFNWNKGNSNFITKINDIRFILDQFSPDYLSICEANFDIHCNVKFPGYNIEYNRLHISNTVSQSLVLIKNSISYNRRYDLENPYMA